jgi:phenylalanyl-tRNA synthetase beta subunit
MAARNAEISDNRNQRVRRVRGRAPGDGKKSVAIALTPKPRDKTLTNEEIVSVSKAIVTATGKATGGVLRT